jgi:DNA excision repair protein ERCC-5
VLKAFDAHESQTRLESFFGFSQRFAKIRSKRIAKAVSGITGKKNMDIMDVEIAPAAVPAKKGRKKKAEGKLVESAGPGSEAGGAGSSRGEEEAAELDPEIGKSIEKAARTVGRGRGTRGRGQSAPRGRGEKGTRGRGRGRGRAKAADVDGQADRDAEGGVLEQESALETGAISEAAVPARRVRLCLTLNH